MFLGFEIWVDLLLCARANTPVMSVTVLVVHTTFSLHDPLHLLEECVVVSLNLLRSFSFDLKDIYHMFKKVSAYSVQDCQTCCFFHLDVT